MNKILIPGLVLFSTFTFAQKQQFTIYFPFNKDVATNLSIENFKEWTGTHNDFIIDSLEGYTDKTGNALYNIDLSERRIKYVQKLLVREGYVLDNSSKIPFGEKKAKAAYSAPDRKVTIYITQKEIVVAKSKEKSELSKKIINAVKGDKIKINNLNFLNNSDIILPESKPALEELYEILKENPNLKIEIQGHICCQKTEQDQVSLKRALAVYNNLIFRGIDKNRLSYKSFGSSKPIHPLPEQTEQQRVDNRRVEVEIIEN